MYKKSTNYNVITFKEGKKMENTVETQEVKEQETKTFTQDEVNSIVQERLFKERKKYPENWESVVEKANKFDQMEEESKTELQRANERAQAFETELKALKAENEIKAIRDRISLETNIPASLLTANTEEECKAQAEAIKAFANPSYPSVKDGGEVQKLNKESARDAFASFMTQSMN